jgi:farnesyl-diphosphate farnesyltransferase
MFSKKYKQYIKKQQHILNAISRTYAIPIGRLPNEIKLIVSNAYILFRIADSIEDSPHLSLDQKKKLFYLFDIALIDVTKQHQFQLQMLELIGSDRLSELIVLEDHFDSVFEVFNEVEKNYQRIITQRLRITMNGMIKYAKRKSNSSVMIESRAMLDEYIFFVAGNVGYLIYDILSEKKIFDKKDPRIKPFCLNLGQSLQLTNILIDKNEDAQHGRYWFPGSSSLGQRSIALYANEVSEKIRQCIYFFQSLNYPHKGIKFFIIFPAYLALATMQKIILNPHFRSKNEIKLTRSEIYKLYFKLLFVKL